MKGWRGAAVVWLGLLATAVQAQPASTTIKLGVEGAYPPFSMIAKNGQLEGFDIDIARALCERMKAKCELVQMEFDALIPGLKAKKIDAIVASMSITPERRKNVDFSVKYYQTPARLIVPKGSPLDGSPATMKGKKIGVQRTTIHDRFASATFKDSQIVRYAKQDEVFLDLKAGRIDATLVDAVAGDEGFLKTPGGQGHGFAGPAYTDPAFFGDGAGIAVPKGDDKLRLSFNAAIAALRADGGYQKIMARYFAYDIYGAEPKK